MNHSVIRIPEFVNFNEIEHHNYLQDVIHIFSGITKVLRTVCDFCQRYNCNFCEYEFYFFKNLRNFCESKIKLTKNIRLICPK